MLCDFTAGVEVVSFSNLASIAPASTTLSLPMSKIPNRFRKFLCSRTHRIFLTHTYSAPDVRSDARRVMA
jgi:hypothetical protein